MDPFKYVWELQAWYKEVLNGFQNVKRMELI